MNQIIKQLFDLEQMVKKRDEMLAAQQQRIDLLAKERDLYKQAYEALLKAK